MLLRVTLAVCSIAWSNGSEEARENSSLEKFIAHKGQNAVIDM